MELWFLYALITIFTGGLTTFFSKVAANRGDDSNIVTMATFGVLLVGGFIMWLVTGASWGGFDQIMWPILASGILFAILFSLRIQALKYIDTTIFFPVYKTLAPLFLLVVGVFYFKDSLDGLDYLGIAVGALVPLLLIHRSEQARQNNLARGLGILLTCVLVTTVTFSLAKYIVDIVDNIWLFVWFQALIAVGFCLLRIIKQNGHAWWREIRSIPGRTWQIGIAAGFFDVVGAYFLFNALRDGLISIVYTINSFYLLVPIVLSVWFYKEHMNTRKALAIGLSIVAILFFQI